VRRLITDNEADYQKIRKYVQTLVGRPAVKKVEHFKGDRPLFEAKRIDKDIRAVYETNVYVKSGAYIVIEPTEAVTVVDVNSGRFKTKSSPEDAAFMVNMEVVPVIARQLRLRDLGGIIVIDFIDMNKEDHKRKLQAALIKELESDPDKTEVFKISPLGIGEMTRARTGKTIESISFGKCPYCQGRGKVKFV
jgi:ribonuclease G